MGGGLETLAEGPGVPVDLLVELHDPVPGAVEVAAYYLVAEALANVAKHSGATGVRVQARTGEGSLTVVVSDTGAGGARLAPSSGLHGLVDRIAALGGSLEIDSPPGTGTTLKAVIPLDQVVLDNDEQRRLTALRWWVQELWDMPSEAADQFTDEDMLMAGKAVLLIAGGRSRVTDREREWLVGYLTAARDADWVIDAVAAYDDSDTLADFMEVPGFPLVARGQLYDAIRMCSSDGPLTEQEHVQLRRAATALGIAHEEFDEICGIVVADGDLRRRRFAAIASRALPDGHHYPG